MQKGMLVLMIFVGQLIYANEQLSKYAEDVLKKIPYVAPSSSIITEREWKELQLDRLVTVLDRSTTSFGRWGLVQLLHPIADVKQLQHRKNVITFLINNDEKLEIFKQKLERIKKSEVSLLSYWYERDLLNRVSEQFYFSSFLLSIFNNSTIALNVSSALEMFNSIKYLLLRLALSGVLTEWRRSWYGQTDFNVWRGVKRGIAEPISHHSWYPYILPVQNTPYDIEQSEKFFIGTKQESWYDRYLLFSRGYEGAGPFVSTILTGQVAGVITATIPTLLFDYEFVTNVIGAGNRVVSLYQTMNSLQQRVSDVAQCMQAIMDVRDMVEAQGDNFALYNSAYDDELDTFFKSLLTKRFLQDSFLPYSRGHVLTMHQDIKRVKELLIPVLHSVGLLDAYCSIARLYKEHEHKETRFSFCNFITAQTPCINYHDAWLPLLSTEHAITNNLKLGCDIPGKIIITGPNGGGKSTILKTCGDAVVLAQSWCITPARTAQQSLFSTIRTALDTREDLEHNLSTFMAEKKVMKELRDDIAKSDAQHPILALIDEPFKGTVEDESARRIYQFGKDVAAQSGALVALATHVQKPITLATDTGGIFDNYQIKIQEIAPGQFKRLFKLEHGPAMWWFDDAPKRSRFVDWLDEEIAASSKAFGTV
jgi:energy-coupling factor transporter ATP-binding protein EcfA2